MDQTKSKATVDLEQTPIREEKSGEINDQSISDDFGSGVHFPNLPDVMSGVHLPNLPDSMVIQTPLSISNDSSD